MQSNSSVALFVPWLERESSPAADDARSSTLARIAGRGALTSLPEHAEIEPWRRALLEWLEFDPLAERHRTGPVMGAALGGKAGEYWLCATPMHFSAGLSDLTASLLEGEQRVSEEHRMRIAESISGHLEAAGFRLETTAQGDWLLRCERRLDARTATPAAAARDLAASMPSGADAPLLKRLMAELQMLLHEHPVNEARARFGAAGVNAIWLHGGGAIEPAAPRALPLAHGDDPYLRGLCALYGAPQPERADSPDALVHESARSAAVLGAMDLGTLDAHWLAPLLRALRARRIGRLEIVLDRWRLAIDRVSLFKIWRGARPLDRWLT